MKNKKPRLQVVQEAATGLNQKFKNTSTGEIMSRGQVADRIGEFPDYHVMKRDGKRIIRSNPDDKEDNNLS